MRRAFWVVLCVALVAAVALACQGVLAQYGMPSEKKPAAVAAKPDFVITASYIEACSCDMFCPCYFNDHSTAHGSQHFCKANLVLKVDKGYYKKTNLDGVKAWLSTDLGADWGKGKAEWLVVTFDPKITAEQQAAMTDILFQLYPLKFNVLGVDKVPFLWEIKGNAAHARLDNGMGEVILERVAGDNAKQEVVAHNLKYWGAQSNTGFRMWKNKRNYYEGHGQKFETNGTNGFLITITFSGNAKQAAAD